MDKLATLRIIATIGMVIFYISAIVAVAGYPSEMPLVGILLWMAFGLWARHLSARESPND